ncbi:MAG: hypothetical protein WAM41_15515 [Psychrobacillus psychrotolerans]|uniref:hypothetical protein n=1 Tax=Psychrobacillus psychrotolerans TaxID=126156 RepID=UPI003BAFF4FF
MIEQWEDEYGKWTKKEDGALIHNPSQKWYDENPLIEPEPQKPTAEEKIALLEAENAMLQMSVMELAMYTAGQDVTLQTQDERITTQESAVMELSMLIAGGMTNV